MKEQDKKLWHKAILKLADAVLKNNKKRSLYNIACKISQQDGEADGDVCVMITIHRVSDYECAVMSIFGFQDNKMELIRNITKWVNSSKRNYSDKTIMGLGMSSGIRKTA